MFFIIIFGQLAINVFNLYGAFMATITTIEPFIKLKVTPKVRIGMIFCVTVAGTIPRPLVEFLFFGSFG
ncbi:hypothetical protein [Peribacillus simplex]|uniref:hypothetical protein n=1 Tax=Peribacillus simplex TaxID=1478 RepID=UPI0037C79631